MDYLTSDYQRFISSVTEEVETLLDEAHEIRVTPVRKNNGVRLMSMGIFKKGTPSSPTIYLERYYREYKIGRSLRQIAEEIVRTYREVEDGPGIDINTIFDAAHVLDRVVCRLISHARNQELLEEVPHREFLDLSVVFCQMIESEHMGRGTVMVTHAQTKAWGIDEDQLMERAVSNMPNLMPVDFLTMSAMLQEFGSPEEMIGETAPLFILTNTQRQYGAWWMSDDSTLRQVSKALQGGFYLLPSSVHECIIVPGVLDTDPEELRDMVMHVNETHVLPQEYLSDTVYEYDCAREELKIAA